MESIQNTMIFEIVIGKKIVFSVAVGQNLAETTKKLFSSLFVHIVYKAWQKSPIEPKDLFDLNSSQRSRSPF